MYCPAAFRQDHLPTLHAQIQACGLAIVTSSGAQGLQASHLPLLLEPDEGEFGTLYGHFARANPHWRDLQGGAEALAVFSGPDAYISPGWYPAKAEHGKVVPTWNYQAVHARGSVEVFDDPERLLQLLERLTDQHEAGRARPWQVADAPADYVQGMLRAIRGLRLPLDSIQGIAKLSQNRNAADREGVRQGLAASPVPGDQALAALIPSPA